MDKIKTCAEDGCEQEANYLVRNPEAPQLYVPQWFCRIHALARCKPGMREMRWVMVDGTVSEAVLESRAFIRAGWWYGPQYGTLSEGQAKGHHVFTNQRDAFKAALDYYNTRLLHLAAQMEECYAEQAAVRNQYDGSLADEADDQEVGRDG